MKTIHSSVLLALAAVALASACSAPGAGDDAAASGTPAPQSTAARVREGHHVASGVLAGARAFRGSAPAFAAGCPTISMIGSDTDSDGATELTALQYTDCAMTTGYGPSIVNGDEAMVDNAEGVNDFNITHAADLRIAVQDSAQTSVHFQAANTGLHGADGWQLTEATDVTIDGADENGSYSEHDQIAFVKLYVPSSAWLPGQPLVAGTYEVSGADEITVTTSEGASDVTFAVSTTDPLVIDPSCATLIVGGSIEAVSSDASATEALQITWTGCNANGVDLVPLP